MKKRKVIDAQNLPMRCPLVGSLVLYLVLDKFDAPGWAWGAVGLLMLILWIAWIADTLNNEKVDLLNKGG